METIGIFDPRPKKPTCSDGTYEEFIARSLRTVEASVYRESVQPKPEP